VWFENLPQLGWWPSEETESLWASRLFDVLTICVLCVAEHVLGEIAARLPPALIRKKTAPTSGFRQEMSCVVAGGNIIISMIVHHPNNEQATMNLKMRFDSVCAFIGERL
jgi:hypothetical protein